MEMATTSGTAAPAASGGNYNVRELLELERKIYEESIEKQVRQHEALLRGELDEYVKACRPFEKDRLREMEIAKTRRKLNEENAKDLLAFEIKQAEDVFQEHRLLVKQRLIQLATQKRDRVRKRLELLDEGLPIAQDEDAESCRLLNESSKTKGTALAFVKADGSLDTKALEKELESARVAGKTAFNLLHLEHNIPPPNAVAEDVMLEMERQRTYQKELKDPDTVCSVVVDGDTGKVWIGLSEVYTVNDHVVLWSSLSDEEFYGQIVSVDKERLELSLVCGSHVTVLVSNLRKQLCTLRHQGAALPDTPTAVDEHMPRTPKRRRQRRKHTIGLRQKI